MHDSEIPTAASRIASEKTIRKRKSKKDNRIQQATDRVVAAAVAGTKANNLADKLLNPPQSRRRRRQQLVQVRESVGTVGRKGIIRLHVLTQKKLQ